MSDLLDVKLMFLEDILLATLSNRLLSTHGRYMGMLPYDTGNGDIVCLLVSCRISVVLRECMPNGFELVREASVHEAKKREAPTPGNGDILANLCIH